MISSLLGEAEIAHRRGNLDLARNCYADALNRAAVLNNLPNMPIIVANLRDVLRQLGEEETAVQPEKMLEKDEVEKSLATMAELV